MLGAGVGGNVPGSKIPSPQSCLRLGVFWQVSFLGRGNGALSLWAPSGLRRGGEAAASSRSGLSPAGPPFYWPRQGLSPPEEAGPQPAFSAAPSRPSALADPAPGSRGAAGLVSGPSAPPTPVPRRLPLKGASLSPLSTPHPGPRRPGRPGWLEERTGEGCGGYSRPPDPGCGSRAGLGDEGGGGPWARPTPLALATCQEIRRGGRGPFKTRARHPLPPSPGERWAENNGEPMGGGQRGGLKGVARSRSLGAGLKRGLGLAARFSKTPRLRRPLLSNLSAPPPRSRPRDAGCAGRCQDARRCRRGPGPLRGRVTEQAKPGAGSPKPPALRGTTVRPQARPPQSARGPSEGAGGGVPGHPALSPPLPGSASFPG